MIAEQPTKKVLKALRAAGWSRLRDSAGSHTIYGCRTGKHDVGVPDGHKSISPGVVRTINKAVASCDCMEEDQ
ncbi:type II toxin-antitoxin system HicA family toxin [Nocardia sp. NPDC051052]|uniref:type II toxin-antitoxin system HicA family toxin n=1 Tax=Nocardia sp. NPDC051052 TaxID=3364322 RepID=UPI00379CE885